MVDGVWKGVYPQVFGRSKQFSQNKFFDLSTPSMRKGRDRGEKKQGEKSQWPLTSLPTEWKADCLCQKQRAFCGVRSKSRNQQKSSQLGRPSLLNMIFSFIKICLHAKISPIWPPLDMFGPIWPTLALLCPCLATLDQRWKKKFLSASWAIKDKYFLSFITSFDKVLALNTV